MHYQGCKTAQKNGKTWYWCTQHVHHHGYFNILYVLHKTSERIDWKTAKNERNVKKANTTAASAASKQETTAANKLTVASCIDEVLCSWLMLYDDDADKLCSGITGQVN